MKPTRTPLCDFVRAYVDARPHRLHMPGHKGLPLLGCEAYDITEIDGADILYHADGVIAESQENARALFGTQKTLYSAEGSSLSIRAMLYLAQLDARSCGRTSTVLAARNVHKVFLSAAALLDFPVAWLCPEGTSLLSCPITPDVLDAALRAHSTPPAAVYVTSPDYLGHIQDIAALAHVCHRHGTLLLVDNAHGAYLHFLDTPAHPMDLLADLCCDSAHKTLPALTGAAYLHLAHTLSHETAAQAEAAMALFASTSPSYLILQSLDALNAYLGSTFRDDLRVLCEKTHAVRRTLTAHGYSLCGDEPCKLTIAPKSFGYTGDALAAILKKDRIIPEFSDPDHLVLMITPQTSDDTLKALTNTLCRLPRRAAIDTQPPVLPRPATHTTPRTALMSPAESVPIEECIGRILAQPTVGCPPAIPIAVTGERITEETVEAFRYWGITHVSVVCS